MNSPYTVGVASECLTNRHLNENIVSRDTALIVIVTLQLQVKGF